MRMRVSGLVVAMGMVLSLPIFTGSLRAQTAKKTPIHSTAFPKLDASLLSKIKIPLRLPKMLPATGGDQIFPVVMVADPEKYEIVLALGLPCQGQHVCTYGRVEGSTHPFETADEEPLPVQLHKGMTGAFIPMLCGAYCGESSIRWQQEHVFYSISIKAGRKHELIAAANSAIDVR